MLQHKGEELAVETPLSAGFAVHIDTWPVSCFASWRSWTRNRLAAVVGNCLQEVSPFCSALLPFLLPVNKLFYSLSGPRRKGGRGGEVLWDGAMEREVKSLFRNVPGQASGWHGPDDCEGILGRGKPGNPVQHLPLCPSLPPSRSLFFFPF